MDYNFCLIGMTGVGKTTFGQFLAQHYHLSFLDTDLVIEADLKCSIQSFMDAEGEASFLHHEHRILMDVEIPKNMVMSTGGSAIYYPDVMTKFKSMLTVIYLRDDCHRILSRIQSLKSRGVVGLSHKTFESLYAEREPLYRMYADIVLDVSDPISLDDMLSQLESLLHCTDV